MGFSHAGHRQQQVVVTVELSPVPLRLVGWTSNRLPTLRPPLPLHSKSFTGSSAASIDLSDATKDSPTSLAPKGPQ